MSLLHHHLRGRLHAEERPGEIHVNNAPPGLFRNPQARLGVSNARIRDKKIEPAVSFNTAPYRPVDIRPAAYVGLNRRQATCVNGAKLSLKPVKRLLLDIHPNNVHALVQQPLRDGPSYPVARSRNYC